MGRLFALLGVMLVAIFAMSAVASTAAFAEELNRTPLNLPFNAGEKLISSSDGMEGPTFETGGLSGKLVCKSAPGESVVESNLPPLGPFHIHLKECKNPTTGATCTGLGEEAGVVLLLGKWHLVYDEEGEKFELHTATLFLIETVHFNCTALVLIELKGELLCLDLEPESSKKSHLYHCEPPPLKDNWCKEDLELEGKHMCVGLTKPKLEASVNHAAFKEAFVLMLGLVEGEREIMAHV